MTTEMSAGPAGYFHSAVAVVAEDDAHFVMMNQKSPCSAVVGEEVVVVFLLSLALNLQRQGSNKRESLNLALQSQCAVAFGYLSV